MFPYAGAGNYETQNGIMIYGYSCSQSMKNKAFYCSDGHLLIVPQKGTILVTTEFGLLRVDPQEILIVPRGLLFSV